MNSTEISREAYSNGYYKNQLEIGLQFQDLVTKALYQRGIIVVGYASKAFQVKEGENMLGAEIKRDGNFQKTGNLYIETAEKSHPDIQSFSPSGIYRKDNSWLFVIGDERCIYIFATKYLQMLEKRFEVRFTPTSRGFLIPLPDADKYCIRKIDLMVNGNTKEGVLQSHEHP